MEAFLIPVVTRETKVRQILRKVSVEGCQPPHGRRLEIPESLHHSVGSPRAVVKSLYLGMRRQDAPVGHIQVHSLVIVQGHSSDHKTPCQCCLKSYSTTTRGAYSIVGEATVEKCLFDLEGNLHYTPIR